MIRKAVTSLTGAAMLAVMLLGCSTQPTASPNAAPSSAAASASAETNATNTPPMSTDSDGTLAQPAEESTVADATTQQTNTASADPAEVCQLEAVNVTLARINDASGVVEAVGAQTPIYDMSAELVGTYVRAKARSGQSDAVDALWPAAEAACSEAGNPVLNRGQVDAMYRLTGWDVFSGIDYFGSDDTSSTSQSEDTSRVLTDPAEVCRAEAVNVVVAAAKDTSSVYNTIGGSSPLVQLAFRLMAPYSQQQLRLGETAAVEAMWPLAEQACSNANNPVLTSGQVQDMYRLTGWSVFQQIGYFGS